MAMYRALQLADPRTDHHGRTLLVTFNRSLLAYLNQVLDDQPSLDVRNYHHFARGYLATRTHLPFGTILEDGPRRDLIAQAVYEARLAAPAHSVLGRDVSFFVQELEWISNHSVATRTEYLAVDRVGRGIALAAGGREAVWDIRNRYLALREERGQRFDWRDLASAVVDELATDSTPRLYKHIVIDEGQDFSPAMLRSLSAAVGQDGSLSFFGDVAQQIYGRSVSWRSAGLDLPAAGAIRFTRNHRNSPQIARIAEAIAAMPYYADTDDLVSPDQFADAGPTPAFVRFDNSDAELDWIIGQSQTFGRVASTGVLFRRNSDADRFCARCDGARKLDRHTPTWSPDPGVWASTVHGAKGFEFQSVIVSSLDQDRWPDPRAVAGDGEDEALAGDGRLLYVAVTRARQNLVLTASSEALSDLLPPNDALWIESRR